MPFPFTCPSCRHTSQVLDHLAGTQARCPTCGVLVDIPRFGVPAGAGRRPAPPAPIPTVHGVDEEVEPLPEVPVIQPLDEADAPRAARARDSSTLALLALCGVVILFCCGGGGVGGYLAFFRSPRPPETEVVAGGTSGTRGGEPGGPVGPATSPRQQLMKSTAWMIMGDGRRGAIGTATVIHRGERLLLTNHHIVRKQEQVIVMFPAYRNGQLVTQPNHYLENAATIGIRARVVSIDPARDLALLQAERLPDDGGQVELATESAGNGQRVHTLGGAERLIGFGNEEGVLWRFQSAQVRRVAQYEHRYADGQKVSAWVVEMPAAPDPNDHGGPIIDDRGRLLGVLCDFDASKRNLRCAIDVREVRAMMENYFISIGRRWTDGVPGATQQGDASQPPSYWIQVLRTENGARVEVARARLIALGRAAILDLRKALRDPDAHLRLAVASLLGAMGENATGAIDDLARAVADADVRVRAAAAQSLGRTGLAAHSALVPLVRATGDDDPAVRDAAVEALRHVGPLVADDVPKLLPLWKEPALVRRERWFTTVRSFRPSGEMAAALFAPLLADSEKSIRLLAIQAVSEAGTAAHGHAFGRLLALADGADADTRRAALAALPKIGPATPAERRDIEAGLRAQSAELRLYCLDQTGLLGEAAASSVPDVARLLRDSDPKVKSAAIRALGRIGKPARIVLDDVFNAARDPAAEIRQAALETLGRLGREERVVAVLVDAIGDESSAVRETALKSLRALQPPVGRDELPILRGGLKSKSVHARRFAAAELARLGPAAAEAKADILAGLKDPDNEVKRHLFELLADYGPAGKEFVPVVLQAMEAILESDGRKEGSVELFRQASLTLARIGDPLDALPVWTMGLKTRDRGLRKEVIRALAAVGAPARKMARELCAMLDDADVGPVVADALLALRGDDVVRALSDLVEESPSMSARVKAVRLLGKLGPEAKNAYQVLYQASTRYKGKELGEAAREALKQIK